MRYWLPALIAVLITGSTVCAQLEPEKALSGVTAAAGLQVELFAHEPMLINPTAIDIDPKGRVWVTEAVNYRCTHRGVPRPRKNGDRIRILIDENGTGKATSAATFYEGPELEAPLGICVIPSTDRKTLRILVAQSPDILEFTCKDANNPVADGPPKKFLTGFGGTDHDHGVHGLNVGPDGKLYFTVGDAGVTGLQSADGTGRKWQSNDTDCRAGTVWRCDLDGTNLELIAHNFRNAYECCVNSFGTIWLGDFLDPRTRQSRLCYVMPGGNYGYHPRNPDREPERTDKKISGPFDNRRPDPIYWHDDQPGIIPRTVLTGAGQPMGITPYDGSLLPAKFWGDLLHCDAGARVVCAVKARAKGAGFELDREPLLAGTDPWFRPVAVRVAPDGSVFIADWYDPNIGHDLGDSTRGRIYRLTPTGHKGYRVPEVKLKSSAEIYEVIRSPLRWNHLLAGQTLREADAALVDGVMDLANRQPDLRVRARAHWACAGFRIAQAQRLSTLDAVSFPLVLNASRDEELLPTAIRMDRLLLGRSPFECAKFTDQVQKKSPALDRLPISACRELLLASRTSDPEKFKSFFYELAKRYDGRDPFYLAALNVACGTDPQRRDALLADFDKHFPGCTDFVLDLIRELRPRATLARIEERLNDRNVLISQRVRLLEVMADVLDAEAGLKLLAINRNMRQDIGTRRWAISFFKRNLAGKWAELRDHKGVFAFVAQGLKGIGEDRSDAVEVAGLSGSPRVSKWLREIAASDIDELQGLALIGLANFKTANEIKTLETVATTSTKLGASIRAIESLGKVQTEPALAVLEKLLLNEKTNPYLRRAAVTALAGSPDGADRIFRLKRAGKFPEILVPHAAHVLRDLPFDKQQKQAQELFPRKTLDPKKLPSVFELAQRPGDRERGEAFLLQSMTSEAGCLRCHMVKGLGGRIGPDLSTITRKMKREELLESILYPSKSIASGYTTWTLKPADGPALTGWIVEETATTITLRDATGKDHQVPVQGTQREKLTRSLMPENTCAALTEDELADLAEYAFDLQFPVLWPDYWYIAGPFTADGGTWLDHEFGPEKTAFDPKAQFKVGDRSFGWQIIKPDRTGYFDLAALQAPAATSGVYYLVRQLESAEATWTGIKLDATAEYRVYANGKKEFTPERVRAFRSGPSFQLKKGTNTIVLKIKSGDAGNGFHAALGGRDGLVLRK